MRVGFGEPEFWRTRAGFGPRAIGAIGGAGPLLQGLQVYFCPLDGGKIFQIKFKRSIIIF